jgi:hypothetical protein
MLFVREVRFVAKRPESSQPWVYVGFPTAEEWEMWNPHICGICCLKMLADTFRSDSPTIYTLTSRCRELGGFREDERQQIRGVFHHPLLNLAREIGFDGVVKGQLSAGALRRAVEDGRFALLSIDLARVRPDLSGGHLLLVHSYDEDSNEFILHDCSEILARPGSNIRLKDTYLERISNHKGLIVWPSAPLTAIGD